MSKTGGGKGTNQHGVRGRSTDRVNDGDHPEAVVDLDLNDSAGASPTTESIFGGEEDGQTPVDEDEAQYLKPEYSWIKTRQDLSQAESDGIADAQNWVDAQTLTPKDVLDYGFVLDLHEKMFGEVWEWGGQIRRRPSNIGNVEAAQVRTSLKILLGDADFWVTNGTYDETEVGTRLHYGLVWRHPFVNGNGRHARLIVETLGDVMGLDPLHFSWGFRNNPPEEARQRYLAALRLIDEKNDFTDLISIVVD